MTAGRHPADRASTTAPDLAVPARSAEQLWQDPRHWDRLGIYRCADDTRLLVRARRGLGWTLNMAHRRAQLVLWIVLIAVLVLVVSLAVAVRRAA